MQDFLKKMTKGKYYSFNEITELILKNSPHRHILKMRKQQMLFWDIAYVESFIQAQCEVGNLGLVKRTENAIIAGLKFQYIL
jgi:hypothetical protein